MPFTNRAVLCKSFHILLIINQFTPTSIFLHFQELVALSKFHFELEKHLCKARFLLVLSLQKVYSYVFWHHSFCTYTSLFVLLVVYQRLAFAHKLSPYFGVNVLLRVNRLKTNPRFNIYERLNGRTETIKRKISIAELLGYERKRISNQTTESKVAFCKLFSCLS